MDAVALEVESFKQNCSHRCPFLREKDDFEFGSPLSSCFPGGGNFSEFIQFQAGKLEACRWVCFANPFGLANTELIEKCN